MNGSFTTRDVASSLRPDYWKDVMARSGLPPLREARRAQSALNAGLRAGRIGMIRFAEIATSASDCVRDARMARQFDEDLFQLDVLTSGAAVLEQHTRHAEVGVGDVMLVDPTRPIRYQTSETTHVTVLFPRTLYYSCGSRNLS